MTNGNTTFSAKRAPNPYKIEVAPGFMRDASSKMKQAFEFIRGEQEARNTQKDYLVGNLETLSGDFTQLFVVLSLIRSKLNETENSPLLDKSTLKKVRKLRLYIDKINSVLMNRLIPAIDELGQ